MIWGYYFWKHPFPFKFKNVYVSIAVTDDLISFTSSTIPCTDKMPCKDKERVARDKIRCDVCGNILRRPYRIRCYARRRQYDPPERHVDRNLANKNQIIYMNSSQGQGKVSIEKTPSHFCYQRFNYITFGVWGVDKRSFPSKLNN